MIIRNEIVILLTIFLINQAVCNEFQANNYDLSLVEDFKQKNNSSLIAIGLLNNNSRVDPVWAPEEASSFNDTTDDLTDPLMKTIKCVEHFYLWTRDFRHGAKFEILNATNSSSVKLSHFMNRQTYVIIHGFLGWGLESWIIQLKNKFLLHEDCNVISVDWPAGTSWFLPSYYTAFERVPTVGNDTAILLDALKDYKGMLLQNVHFVGHSLGAHAAGFASKHFLGRVGRISGLDPAGPYYHKVSADSRLDKSDAIYVDIIHTNACSRWPYWTDCYGLNENIGHSDFWPNGGTHQPHCISGWVDWAQPRGDIGCDHEIAYTYFIESLNYYKDEPAPSNSYFLSRPCEDGWRQYLNRNCSCGAKYQFMGINVNTEVNGVFYLETSAYTPYAMEDPDCNVEADTNFLILVGYLLIIVFAAGSTIALTCYTIRRICIYSSDKCCTENSHHEESRNLINDRVVVNRNGQNLSYGSSNIVA